MKILKSRLMAFFLLTSLLLLEHLEAIIYRCDDDQILAVQSFGNDTIRMHCQKPNLCGYEFLKCRYEQQQPYCGGKTNFVSHVQQISPISPVIHTCCNLTENENLLVSTHTGNDCFLYDLPDGTNGSAAEEAEKEDEEGYMLLKNVNKIPEQFEGYSGYRLRLYLLRNKIPSQLVVKGIERNEAGYRVTICRAVCHKRVEEKKNYEIVQNEQKQFGSNGTAGLVSRDKLKRIELTLNNLTDDGRWLIAAWAEWGNKQWSHKSGIHWNKLDRSGDKESVIDRHRMYQNGNREKIFGKGESKNHIDNEPGPDNSDSRETGFRAPIRHKIEVDEDRNGVAILSKNFNPGEAQARGVKTSVQRRKGHRHSHERTESSECDDDDDDDDYHYDEEEDKKEIAHEENRRKKGRGNSGVSTRGAERKTESFVAVHAEGSKTKEANAKETVKNVNSNTGEKFDLFLKTNEEVTDKHSSTVSTIGTDISRAKEDESQSSEAAVTTGQEKKDISKAKEDENDDSSKRSKDGKGSDEAGKSQENKEKLFEGRKHPASDDIGPEHTSRRNPEKSFMTKDDLVAKENIFADSGSTENSIHPKISDKSHEELSVAHITVSTTTSLSTEASHNIMTINLSEEEKRPRNSGNDEKERISSESESKKESLRRVESDDTPIVSAALNAAPTTGRNLVLQEEQEAERTCFSSDTKVYTQKGEKAMNELKVGDFVLVPASKNQLRYERIEMFYHRDPEKRAKFVVLETETGRKLSLTELHLLPLGDCEAMHLSLTDAEVVDKWLQKSKFAYKAQIGDCVFSIGPNHELQVDRIIKIGRRYLKGIYSPMTVEGAIVTDGILASCFSQVESHFSQKLVYDFLISLYRVFGRVMQSVDEPIQHLPSFIESVHYLSRYVLPFVKY